MHLPLLMLSVSSLQVPSVGFSAVSIVHAVRLFIGSQNICGVVYVLAPSLQQNTQLLMLMHKLQVKPDADVCSAAFMNSTLQELWKDVLCGD